MQDREFSAGVLEGGDGHSDRERDIKDEARETGGDQVVEEAQGDTHAEVLAVFFQKTIRDYFTLKQCEVFLENIDLNHFIRTAVANAPSQNLTSVLFELGCIFARKIDEEIQNANFAFALKFFVLAIQCVPHHNRHFIHDLGVKFHILRKGATRQGSYKELVDKAYGILPQQILITFQSIEDQEARMDPTWPQNYRDLGERDLSKCPTRILIQYAVQARHEDNTAFIVLFQTIIVEREPSYIKAHILLTLALEKLNRLKEALAVREKIVALGDRNEINLTAIVRLKRLLARKAMRGSSFPPATPPLPPAPAPAVSATPPPPPVAPSPPPAPPIREPEPTPKPINLDTSRFDHFLESLQREGENFDRDFTKQGDRWRVIPRHEVERIKRLLDSFYDKIAVIAGKNKERKFFAFLDQLRKQIDDDGNINLGVLGKTIGNLPKEIDWNKTGLAN